MGLLRRVHPVYAVLLVGIALILYNEWLVYTIVLKQCGWPSLDNKTAKKVGSVNSYASPLHVLLLTDLHLYGYLDGSGYIIGKLHREFQVRQSFQTAVQLFKPDAVFVLGDLFHKGHWFTFNEFISEVERFRTMFQVDEEVEFHVVNGNHDFGFHEWSNITKSRRFEQVFSAPSVRLVRIRDSVFVLLNSIAFEGDGCEFCREAEERLQHVVDLLKCSKSKSQDCSESSLFNYTRPILLQHFPMFRPSDAECMGPDVAPSHSNTHYTEKIDVLSKNASDWLMELLEPRLIFNGHKHYSCRTDYNGVPAWTVASFSWRNRNRPSFLMLTVTNNNYAINQCFLPRESTVLGLYAFAIVCLAITLSWQKCQAFRTDVTASTKVSKTWWLQRIQTALCNFFSC